MKRTQIFIMLLSFFALMATASAKINAMFHPYDPTLETIAQLMGEAKQEINVVMYNMDTTNASPIIQKLKSEEMKKRILSGELKVRILFEGYGTPAENEAKMQELEDMGIDVRALGISKKVHHKFAVIDPGLEEGHLITGSANWSLSSAKNYSENIIFAQNEPQLLAQFHQEFILLWGHSQEFGQVIGQPILFPNTALEIDENSAHADFNSVVFFGAEKNKFYLTTQLVQAIDQAESEIQIATTRFKLAPLYAAIMRAAERGVKIKIALSMDEYESFFERRKSDAKNKIENCVNLYDPKCSSGVNFAPELAFGPFARTNIIELRIKFFSLKQSDYLQNQLHSKYLIIDRKKVVTGSFNWSYSSENSHVENIVTLPEAHSDAVLQFGFDFERLWDLNRSQYQEKLAEVKSIDTVEVKCKFAPMTLTMVEIDRLLFPAKNLNPAKRCK